MNNRLARCPKCGVLEEKRRMRPLFSAEDRYHPPKILCYLCNPCYASLLEELEMSEWLKLMRPPPRMLRK